MILPANKSFVLGDYFWDETLNLLTPSSGSYAALPLGDHGKCLTPGWLVCVIPAPQAGICFVPPSSLVTVSDLGWEGQEDALPGMCSRTPEARCPTAGPERPAVCSSADRLPETDGPAALGGASPGATGRLSFEPADFLPALREMAFPVL